MKKLERRAILCLLLAAILVVGSVVFTVRMGVDGDEWASFYANRHVYAEGRLAVGAVVDRNGVVLLRNDAEGMHFSAQKTTRTANLHVTGDAFGNISTGAAVAFRDRMIGYNPVTGTKGAFFGLERYVRLTVDSALNETAYEALSGRNGLVLVYDWKRGDIVCMVSTPAFDPAAVQAGDPVPDGSYLNKCLSAAMTPGSIFKLVTAAAALDTLPDAAAWTFTCEGSYAADGGTVTCSQAHGEQTLAEAFVNSCNCAFGALCLQLGPAAMADTVEKLGLTESMDLNGIPTVPGSFSFEEAADARAEGKEKTEAGSKSESGADSATASEAEPESATESESTSGTETDSDAESEGPSDYELAWSGAGQGEDLINPLSMLAYVGAIAGNGKAARPTLLSRWLPRRERLLDADTAGTLQKMMRRAVSENYGDARFPGLTVYAKTGTAEVGGPRMNGWFAGYCERYAFIVCVEGGGSGVDSAAPVANAVLQALLGKEEN